MSEQVLLAFSTFPRAELAEEISRQLIEERLVACANILPPVCSLYRWEGKIESANETLVLFKTTAGQFADLRSKLRALHPYDVPELVCVNVTDGLPDYLRWVVESCGRELRT
ncbi:MAG: divalent-cation tolerance protein CutA [Chthoniobacterales bacterium]